jgi:hypothetical protein
MQFAVRGDFLSASWPLSRRSGYYQSMRAGAKRFDEASIAVEAN